MNEDKDLRDCSAYAKESLKTSFYIHHKIMSALQNNIKNIELSGIVKIDKTVMNILFSGNHKIHDPNSLLPRHPYKRKNVKHR
ncbi:MAG: hypothetical protein UJ210_00005 [Massilimicrobiota sp.]|nr:hypothetical protein [Massilimicrobiota sp.]